MNRKKNKNKAFSRNDNNKKKSKVVDSVIIKNNEKKGKVVDSVNNDSTLPPNTNTGSYQQPKIGNNNNNNNRSLIVRVSGSGKTHLVNQILLRKQDPVFIITSSLNQNPKIRAKTSDEFQPLENYENIVVSGDIILSKQESDIDLFFTRGGHNNIDIYYISQSYFHLPKFTIRNN